MLTLDTLRPISRNTDVSVSFTGFGNRRVQENEPVPGSRSVLVPTLVLSLAVCVSRGGRIRPAHEHGCPGD